MSTRLLSPAGVPKLRRIATQRLKFKGKGHEVWRLTETKKVLTDVLWSTVLRCGPAVERVSVVAR